MGAARAPSPACLPPEAITSVPWKVTVSCVLIAATGVIRSRRCAVSWRTLVLWFFLFFIISGFCSILYEIIWLRLAMADFGVTSALVSIVLSVFMAGMGLGAWASGHFVRKYGEQLKYSALNLYALTELLIGVSAILVPYELTLGRAWLERTGVSS